MKKELLTIKITVRAIEPSLNKFLTMHWGTRAKLKSEWGWAFHQGIRANRSVFGLWQRMQADPALLIKHCIILITYFFPNNNRRDPDNFGGKFAMDFLKQNFIIDDNTKVVMRLDHMFFVDKMSPRTEITIEELA